jgi:hypothetical protein
MRTSNTLNKRSHQSGFVALLSTIIIGAILLVLTIEVGQAGFYTRFMVLGTQWKEQSRVVAQSCGEQALAHILTDTTWTGGSTSTLSQGVCHTSPIQKNYPSPGLLTIRVSGEVKERFTNLVQVYQMGNVYLGTTPLSAQSSPSPVNKPLLISSTEVAVRP